MTEQPAVGIGVVGTGVIIERYMTTLSGSTVEVTSAVERAEVLRSGWRDDGAVVA